jgi:hypothetical protein
LNARVSNPDSFRSIAEDAAWSRSGSGNAGLDGMVIAFVLVGSTASFLADQEA